MIVREIKTEDAEKLANLMKQVEADSQYMLWEAGERTFQPEKQLKMIQEMNGSENSTILVAEKDTDLTGFLLSFGGSARRNKHSVYVVIGILKEYRGNGIGTLLFKKLEQWALKHNIHRIELTVVARNEAGLSLYKKMGYEIEGIKRDSLLINGEFMEEYYMAKLM